MLNELEPIPLKDTYGTYNLFEKNKKYYAIPKEIRENPDDIILQKKAIVANNKKELIEILDDINKWSNSRGNYEKTDNNKIYIKANSFSAFDENVSNFFMFPIILNVNGQLYITDRANEVFKDVDKKKKSIELNDIKNFKFLNDFKTDSHPELIFIYEGFSIVEIDKRYFASNRNIKEINWFDEDLYNNKEIFYSKTIKGVMSQVDKYHKSLFNKVKRNFKNMKNKFYRSSIISKIMVFYRKLFIKGKTEMVTLPLNEKASKIFEFLNSDASLEETLDVINSTNKKERLVKKYEEFNIYLFEGTYFAIPCKQKDFNFNVDTLLSDNNIFNDTSLDNLESVISGLK